MTISLKEGKMAGARQKSVAEKKLIGTYRKDRDGKAEIVENEFKKTAIIEGTAPIVPEQIKSKELQQLYIEHFNRLVNFGLLIPSDIIEFNQIYLFAQQIQDLNNELQKQNITTVKGFEKYQHLTYVILKLSARLSDLGKKYYISPSARAKMTLDELDIQKKSNENESVISKLIHRAKEV